LLLCLQEARSSLSSVSSELHATKSQVGESQRERDRVQRQADAAKESFERQVCVGDVMCMSSRLILPPTPPHPLPLPVTFRDPLASPSQHTSHFCTPERECTLLPSLSSLSAVIFVVATVLTMRTMLARQIAELRSSLDRASESKSEVMKLQVELRASATQIAVTEKELARMQRTFTAAEENLTRQIARCKQLEDDNDVQVCEHHV
jgi:septal ring factor EnvC (AmiA/AmiB activator)